MNKTLLQKRYIKYIIGIILAISTFLNFFFIFYHDTTVNYSSQSVSKEQNKGMRPLSRPLSEEKSGPRLCVIVRTYHAQYDYLPITLLSLSANPKSNMKVYVVLTEEASSIDQANEIALHVNNMLNQSLVSVLPITSEEVKEIKQDSQNDFGYARTDVAMNRLLKNDKNEECDYFLVTNGDNLYSSLFVDSYLKGDMEEDFEIIGFDFISRYHWGTPENNYDGDVFISDDNSRKRIYAKFVLKNIDLGAYAFKKELLVKFDELRFLKQKYKRNPNGGFEESDGYFIEFAAAKSRKKIIHRQILFIHQ